MLHEDQTLNEPQRLGAGLQCLHDRQLLARFLRRDPLLHLYQLGDLDPFFWSRTTWYGWSEAGELTALLLLYAGPSSHPPTLLLSTREPHEPSQRLLEAALPLLPPRFYAHLGPGGAATLAPRCELEHRGRFLRLGLTRPELMPTPADAAIRRLGPDDQEALLAFYQRSYPENWFDPRMLATRRYFGTFDAGQLVAVAGVHVVSLPYGAAALGNVATAPERRRQGLGRAVTARLCRDLRHDLEHVGLNVAADNEPALACYRQLGFTVVAPYDEYLVHQMIDSGRTLAVSS